MKIKLSKNGFCFIVVMALYAVASTLEYNDLVHMQTQGVK